MRKHFHRDLRGKIIGELAKDFRHGRAKASDMVGHNVCYRGKYRYRYTRSVEIVQFYITGK